MNVCFTSPAGNQIRTMHIAPVKGMYVKGLADMNCDFCEITGVLYDLNSDMIYCEIEEVEPDFDRSVPRFKGAR